MEPRGQESKSAAHYSPGLLSIVIPLFNEELNIPILRAELTKALAGLTCGCEFVLVDDGSSDSTASLLEAWGEEDARVRHVILSRNFGHQIALTAGLDHSSPYSFAVVTMDADMQDPPSLIPRMLAKYSEGYDIVYARRSKRVGEGGGKRLSAWVFYRLLKIFVSARIPVDVGDFRLLSRAAVSALAQMRENHRFIRGLVAEIGLNSTVLEFERPPRAAGETKYSIVRMITLCWDAAFAFSVIPMRVVITLGLLVTGIAFGWSVYSIVRHIAVGDTVPGWTTLVALQSMIGGAILVTIGVIGEYLARIYGEIKGRPLYFVKRHREDCRI